MRKSDILCIDVICQILDLLSGQCWILLLLPMIQVERPRFCLQLFWYLCWVKERVDCLESCISNRDLELGIWEHHKTDTISFLASLIGSKLGNTVSRGKVISAFQRGKRFFMSYLSYLSFLSLAIFVWTWYRPGTILMKYTFLCQLISPELYDLTFLGRYLWNKFQYFNR